MFVSYPVVILLLRKMINMNTCRSFIRQPADVCAANVPGWLMCVCACSIGAGRGSLSASRLFDYQWIMPHEQNVEKPVSVTEPNETQPGLVWLAWHQHCLDPRQYVRDAG